MRSGKMPLSSIPKESVTATLRLKSRRSNPRSALTGSGASRYKTIIPWSFEPAGLQPR
jgi:hypothetical protein